MLYTHIIQLYILTQWIKMSGDFFKKIYLSLYCKVCLWEGVGDWTKTAIYWPPLLWPSSLCLFRSPGLLNRRPRGSLCWLSLLHLITNWSGPQTPSGVPRASSAGWWLSLPHLLQIIWSPTHWLPVFTELYNSSIALSIFGMACLIVIKRK